MLSGHAPFHVNPGDDGAAMMARIEGEQFSSNLHALDHILSLTNSTFLTAGIAMLCVMKVKFKLYQQTFSSELEDNFTIYSKSTETSALKIHNKYV
jgi:hypothetical protein